MNEEFNLSFIENEELHLQPTNFAEKLPRMLLSMIFCKVFRNRK